MRAFSSRSRPFWWPASRTGPGSSFSPFDLAFDEAHCFDPLRTNAAPFLLDLLCHLDVAAFGAHGMAMPRWIFFDGGELSGGIVGFGRPAHALAPEARALLQVPDGYRGLVPLSMYIAIPTFDRSIWVGHNLASLSGRVAGDDLRGLGGSHQGGGAEDLPFPQSDRGGAVE